MIFLIVIFFRYFKTGCLSLGVLSSEKIVLQLPTGMVSKKHQKHDRSPDLSDLLCKNTDPRHIYHMMYHCGVTFTRNTQGHE